MRSAILESAVQYARKRGVLVVAAAGNSGGAVDYPGAYPGVLAVGATGRTDTLAQFSSRGPEVGLSAPGVEVTQQTICQGGLNRCELFGTFSGTSMASPHVAGAAALVMSMGVTHPDDVRTVLVRSSRSMGSAATIPDPLLRQGASAPTRHGAHGGGAGILQAGAAVAGAHWSRVGFRLSALVLFVLALHRWIRRKRGTFAWSPVSVGSAVWGAVGLLPALPWVAPVGGAASLRPWLEGLLRPVAEWDLLLGVRAHGYLALASVIPPLAVAAVALGRPAGRAIAGGLALGTAAYLAPIVVHADVLGPFGPGVLGAAVVRIWAAANVVACLWLARVTLDRTL
jgi:serine protease